MAENLTHPQAWVQPAPSRIGVGPFDSLALNPDTGEFRPMEELRALYAEAGVDGDKEVTLYCRIRERSAHT